MDDGIRYLFLLVARIVSWAGAFIDGCLCVCEIFYFRAYHFSTKESPSDRRPEWSSEAEGKDSFQIFHETWNFKNQPQVPNFTLLFRFEKAGRTDKATIAMPPNADTQIHVPKQRHFSIISNPFISS